MVHGLHRGLKCSHHKCMKAMGKAHGMGHGAWSTVHERHKPVFEGQHAASPASVSVAAFHSTSSVTPTHLLVA